LRCHPQMRPRFFPRDFHRPATHKPGQYLFAGLLQMGRQQGLGFEALVRVANQDPAESHRRLARVIPDRRVRGNLHLTGAFPIPMVNGQRAPLRLLRRKRSSHEPGQPLRKTMGIYSRHHTGT
jgi:hypothetical protein